MYRRRLVFPGGLKPSAGPGRKRMRAWLLAAVMILSVGGLAFAAGTWILHAVGKLG